MGTEVIKLRKSNLNDFCAIQVNYSLQIVLEQPWSPSSFIVWKRAWILCYKYIFHQRNSQRL